MRSKTKMQMIRAMVRATARRGALLTSLLIAVAATAKAEQVVIATTGGDYERILREAWFDPFTKATGVKVVAVSATNTEMRAHVKAMTESKTVTWDIYQDGRAGFGVGRTQGCRRGYDRIL
jgi:mannopine transport system substrate-binding protein